MNINRVLQQIDECFRQNKGAEAEAIMQEGILQAAQEGDDASLLQLLNELMGYYRETSQVEASYKIAEAAMAQAKRMGLEETIPYATTLLNAANAYRAGGRLGDSLAQYRLVQELYDRLLEPEDMLMASLENNISLLYQEMHDYQKSKNYLKKALAITEARGELFETAVSCANLAGTCLELSQPEEAYAYALRAKELFEHIGVADTHYGAALAALGTFYYQKRAYAEAKEYFEKAMNTVRRSLGTNEYYERLRENVMRCEEALRRQRMEAARLQEDQSSRGGIRPESVGSTGAKEKERPAESGINGLTLCRMYYQQCVVPMLEKQFPQYVSRIAVGLVGEGSDCFGYDDSISVDHDWGPDVCLWVTDETWQAIGEDLQRAYEALPNEFLGYKRTVSPQGQGRRGVMRITDFYQRLLGTVDYEQIDWSRVEDASLAAAVNGEVFRDDEGIFSSLRRQLQKGFPERIRFLKLAQEAARFSQNAQYNWKRMLQRGDGFTADLLLGDGIWSAMRLLHYIDGTYPPHEKWLLRSMQGLEGGAELAELLLQLQKERIRFAGGIKGSGDPQLSVQPVADLIEAIGTFLAQAMYAGNWISDVDPYLDQHTPELLAKATLSQETEEQLVEQIVRLEFEAFDKVQNVGGRASCQNDWLTFSIMRRSQYQTWNRTMLLQYLYDFYREYNRGHNLIEEKYGRMMESTAPLEYAKIKAHFPQISKEKRKIIEQIVAMQVAWMEEFAAQYPHLAGNARSIHTIEDDLYNTSYETYLRGELGTYSDKMLELYGRYVVEYARAGRNLAHEIMENSTLAYGYESLDAAERFLG